MTSKILVIRFSSLGDVILASAPVLNLKIGFPGSKLIFLTKKRFSSVAARIPGVDRVVTISESPGIREIFCLIKSLELEDIDTIIDLQGNFRSFLVRSLVYAKQKFVYARDRAFRNRVVELKDFPDNPVHTIDKYNDCINQLGLGSYAKRPLLSADYSDISTANSLIITIAPGASSFNKQWPPERFAEVAIRLHQIYSAKIIWAVTSNEKPVPILSEKIKPDYLVHLVDSPLDKLADIIRSSDLCIANDSGIAHLSSAVSTPVISVFGPTHPALGFAPRGLLDRVIEVDEFCRPCSVHGHKPCFRSERFCFTRINPEVVVSTAVEILDKRKNRSKALFIDRDGTLIIDKPFDSNPDNLEFETGSIDALLKAQKLGFKLVIVSNQSGIARGFFKYEDAENFNRVLVDKLSRNGVKIDAVYFCPHYSRGIIAEYARNCDCRKPAAGMAEKAARELNIDLRRSYVIGDKLDDFNLGRIIGATSFLVKTGQGRDYLDLLRNLCENHEEYVCENLNDAVGRIEFLETTGNKPKIGSFASGNV